MNVKITPYTLKVYAIPQYILFMIIYNTYYFNNVQLMIGVTKIS